MRSIVNYFLKNPVAGNLLMIFLFIVGIIGLLSLKSTFFPETPSRIIVIQSIFPGSSPEEMEEGVITKIEEALEGVTGVERTTSVSSENSGTVSIEVLKGYDTDLILQDVKNAVDRIPTFPVSMEPLVIFKQEFLGRSFAFALSGDVELITLKEYARKVEDDLLAKDGISKILLNGFPEEEIEISVREKDLRSNDLTFDQVALAISNYNLEATGGTIKTDREELNIRARNKQYYAEELRNVVIRSNQDGGVVKLHQVADVEDQWQDVPSRTFINGKPAVVVTVQNTIEEDMLTIADDVLEYVNKFNAENEVIQATVISNGAETLNGRINLLKENGLIGFLIVLFLLGIFLHYRLAFWVALAIPISFAGMFIISALIGITINVISLFGMIVVIGILVDDGIVIAENIYQKYEKGYPPMEAALEGTMEVLPAVFSAILTTVIAFCTFFMIEGRLGDIFRELSIVVIFSLVFSLVEGALILPAHIAHSKALKKDGKDNWLTIRFEKLMYLLRNVIYEPFLRWSIKYSFPIVGFVVAGLFITFGAFQGGLIKGTFFPVIPRDQFNVDLKLPSGQREDLTIKLLDSIEVAANRVNQRLGDRYYDGENSPITFIEKNIGPLPNQGQLSINLLKSELRDSVTTRMVINELRREVGQLYEAESLTYGLGGFFGDPVSISLLSADKESLEGAIEDLKSRLNAIPDLTDVADSDVEGVREINLEMKDKAYNLGFTLRDIVGYVRQGFFGAEVQRIQRGVDEVRVWVRYKLDNRNDISDLSEMRIRTGNGLSVPLEELVEFKDSRGVVNINHIDGSREVRVTADVADDKVSVSEVNALIQEDVLPKVLEAFPLVSVGFEGQQRENAKTISSMRTVMPIVLMLMFFVIILTFNSWSQALLVFAILPFGFIGVGLGHYIIDIPISLFSVLGVIALIGIIVNDALVFITTFNGHIRAGMPFKEAVFQTGISRFRPILLTSITTIAGLGPIILEKSAQAQFLIPMAVAIAFGLMIVTFIILLLTPSLLVIINRIKRVSMGFWLGHPVSAEMVEPAYPGRKTNVVVNLIGGLIMLGGFIGLVLLALQIAKLFI
ncbi:MAG: efflux RND transporter permease subunit [Saprospiraceae bacterium]|nr:efflux RND transporter permease subunit [Saprospiraceae bacterium]